MPQATIFVLFYIHKTYKWLKKKRLRVLAWPEVVSFHLLLQSPVLRRPNAKGCWCFICQRLNPKTKPAYSQHQVWTHICVLFYPPASPRHVIVKWWAGDQRGGCIAFINHDLSQAEHGSSHTLWVDCIMGRLSQCI